MFKRKELHMTGIVWLDATITLLIFVVIGFIHGYGIGHGKGYNEGWDTGQKISEEMFKWQIETNKKYFG
jgi:hypothetical protein